jgi:O-antigen biosynthesis protein
VLYHWRAIEGSTASSSKEKTYTTDAGIKALKDYFADNGPQGIEVKEGFVPNTYRVKYPIPDPAPLVSLLIPTRDRLNLIEPCVRSIIEKSTYKHFEILILDNGSCEPETLEFFEAIKKQDPRVNVISYDRPFNYSAINNYGVQQAKGSIIGLVNNDIEVINPDWLTEMVSQVSRSEIGCVGAKLYFENDTIQHGGVICSLGGVAGHSHKHFPRDHPGYFYRLLLPQSLSAVTAACLLVRRHVYEQVEGLDEENLRIAFNDVDFCLKVREAGYRNLWTPYAELYHYESISRGTEDTPEKQERFRAEIAFMQKKWGSMLDEDPFYSSNLTKDREDFSLSSR